MFQNYDKISIKITDFNLSKEIFSPTNSDRWSLWYQSPEIINSEPYSFKTDVWYIFSLIEKETYGLILKHINYLRSTGCVIYELITLKKAFPGNSILEINDHIIYKTIPSLKVSLELEPLIKL